MTSPHTLNSIANDGTGLRLQLHWEQDRYHHHIDWISGDLVTRLLESTEIAAEDLSAQRPVFQQVSVESRGLESQVALAVGMGGQSHWSMSIETVPESRTLVFDVACRVTTPFESLASCYQLLAPVSSVESRKCEFNVMGHPCQVEVDPSAKSEKLQLELSQSQLQLTVEPLDLEVPRTVRWRYRVIG